MRRRTCAADVRPNSPLSPVPLNDTMSAPGQSSPSAEQSPYLPLRFSWDTYRKRLADEWEANRRDPPDFSQTQTPNLTRLETLKVEEFDCTVPTTRSSGRPTVGGSAERLCRLVR